MFTGTIKRDLCKEEFVFRTSQLGCTTGQTHRNSIMAHHPPNAGETRLPRDVFPSVDSDYRGRWWPEPGLLRASGGLTWLGRPPRSQGVSLDLGPGPHQCNTHRKELRMNPQSEDSTLKPFPFSPFKELREDNTSSSYDVHKFVNLWNINILINACFTFFLLTYSRHPHS